MGLRRWPLRGWWVVGGVHEESCDGIGLSAGADWRTASKKTARAGLAVCLSLHSKIVAIDFLLVCLERDEFGVEEVASVGKDRDEVWLYGR
jgi:hypothetical protein